MSQNSKFGEFENYLQGKTDLSQQYADLPPVELPDHLDAAILAEAHRAVNSRPGAKPKRRWTMPLSLVASLIVAVMIGLQLPYLLKDAALPQQDVKTAVAAMDKGAAEPYAAPEVREQAMVQSMAKPKSEIGRNEPLAAAAPAPMVPQETVPAEGKPSSAAPVAAVPLLAPTPAPAIAAKRFRESADTDNGAALSKEKKAAGHAEGNVSGAFERSAPAAARAATPDRSQLKDEEGDPGQRPEDWLIRIQRLKQQGKLDEAKKELTAFKKRYPDYPVPAALEAR